MATHSSILARRIPWTEEPGGLQSMGLQESDTTERLNHHRIFLQIIYVPMNMCVLIYTASLIAQSLKNLPAVQTTWL